MAIPLHAGRSRHGVLGDGDEPAPFASVRIPTLLVLGRDSYLPYDHLLDRHRDALGDLLEIVTVPGGHTVLWDALDETASAITTFLA